MDYATGYYDGYLHKEAGKKTNVTLAMGTLAALPSAYRVGSSVDNKMRDMIARLKGEDKKKPKEVLKHSEEKTNRDYLNKQKGKKVVKPGSESTFLTDDNISNFGKGAVGGLATSSALDMIQNRDVNMKRAMLIAALTGTANAVYRDHKNKA